MLGEFRLRSSENDEQHPRIRAHFLLACMTTSASRQHCPRMDVQYLPQPKRINELPEMMKHHYWRKSGLTYEPFF
ncbi:hypothetical protein JTE90_024364 [Oedothorax gibbosus]|uniref:Uncharacterized protein n=1 Tax=Oedothorax gibbosus TaxID=931172 RepID=A0AAV6W090_9ARAC|nr:hypothetical protein JTE90_024364 [Oedothorax gibbosus]